MSEDKTVTLKPVDLVEPEPGFSSSHLDPADTSYQPPALDKTPGQPDLQGLDSGHPGTEEKGPVGPTPDAVAQGNRWTSTLDQFKLKRFFVLRPGTMDQALEDIKALVNQDEDGDVHGVWLMAEVDHWNNERERVVLITDSSLLVCKYDFVMLNCEHIQRIPLNFVDRITHGNFSFPQRSLLTREGEGVRVFWDRLREPSFSSRWNPFTTDYPFSTFTYHPVRNIDQRFTALCEIQSFREQLTEAAQKAHLKQPIPGKANGVLVLNQPLLIESYVGLMSFIGNQNKLGYCLARGNIGF
ncbi:tumor protein p63-regulated gene 1 protein [Oncorhynchus tshawytscha]|uniref:HSac2 domain-containing protein n=1 Tax=Oncorhynchus tshawytscha TaxID=74940 RepID=A0AAZ3P8D2_ONCTS|nr:tumor protein p63-regulated gene 1 protein [Oncorhynchus tshawytscha]